MKSLNKIDDRRQVYKIEAARFSFIMLEKSYQNLMSTLRIIEKESHSNESAVHAIMHAWQFIDMSFRFFRVLSEIRGLKHKDEKYKNAERENLKIEKARNFIQHLNTRISKVSDDIYPILGAISWASENYQDSFTISLGTLPKGTYFHSLAYDQKENKYIGDIILNVNDLSINIFNTYQSMLSANNYLNDFLQNENYLSDEELIPDRLIASALHFGADSKRFNRVKFFTNP